jgi:hypothetical protein
MNDIWKRASAALLAGFVSFVIALPVACGGLMLYSEHVYGDIDANGPASILGGMGIALILAVLVVVFTFWKTAPSD